MAEKQSQFQLKLIDLSLPQDQSKGWLKSIDDLGLNMTLNQEYSRMINNNTMMLSQWKMSSERKKHMIENNS